MFFTDVLFDSQSFVFFLYLWCTVVVCPAHGRARLYARSGAIVNVLSSKNVFPLLNNTHGFNRLLRFAQ
jgi:hypothetical protein